ncbi:protein containing cell adhesion domain protein [Bacillus thuringiensis]|uniref:protein containing cell adhesion domain protein n=1 Tax=Bacillus thuringiensis TaxID=1428 RepID=UPI002E24E39D
MARQLGKNLLQPEPGWTREYCFLENAKPGMFFSNVDLDNKITGDKWRAVGDTNRLEQNSAWYVGDTLGRSFYFKFTGTAVRILLKNFTTHAYNITVTIDNISYGGSVPAYSSEYSLVVFEKLDLIKGEHNVKVTTNGYASGAPGTAYTFITAVDYADLSANVGDVLTQPEPGWSRFDDRNSAIRYEGNWQTYNNQSSGDGYLGSYHIKNNDKDKLGHVFFNFTGTKLRILAYRTDGLYFDNTKIVIDGVTYDIPRVDKPSSVKTVVVFEKTDLSPGTHSVDMYDYYLNLDAIDVGQGESIVEKAKVGEILKEPEPGWRRHKFNEKLDDGTEAIKYYPEGAWIVRDSGDYTHTKNHVGYLRFKFYGSAIRIISTHFSDTATNTKITINGKTSFHNFRGNADGDLLSFEQANLPLGIHTVEIDANNSGKSNLSAIDLKDGEYLVPLIKVGEALLQPEPGWTRYDDTSINIKYSGPWSFSLADTGSYNNSIHYTVENAGVTFSFYGKSLRLIGLVSTGYKKANIIIDGKILDEINFNSAVTERSILLYEKKDLTEGKHTVTIWGEYINLDAIDFNGSGFLIPPVKVGERLKEPELGWKRFDDRDQRIFYENPDGGSWIQISVDPTDYYNGTLTYKEHVGMPRLKVKFKFKGIQLRILGTRFTTNLSKYEEAKILIDGVQYVYNQNGTSNQFCTLLFESPVLNQDVHTVEITTGKDPFDFDCIDILGGDLFLLAKVGDVLTQPELGWKRFDDTDSNIKYEGNWVLVDNQTNYHNSTARYKNSIYPSPVDNSAISATFKFKGTKLRIIGVSNKLYDSNAQIIINGNPEAISFYANRDVSPYRLLLFDKQGLTDEIHTVELKGIFMNLDAIDINDTGELLPIETKKVKVSLYEKESGKIFVDDFDSINPKWLMSLSSAFNNAIKKGFLRMNHSADKDVMLLIDKPQGNFAIQVIADYAPTKEGDEGGLLLYQNEKNKVEFLESYAANSSQSNKEWLAICKEDQWDFYTKTDTFFDYANKDSLSTERIGVVLKRGTEEGFVPLDINKIIMTKSNMLRLRQLYENYKIVLKDTADNTLSTNIVATAHTGIDILLPSLEFEGIVEIYDEENELLAKKQTTFYGGDMYCMGSSLQIKMNNDELNTTDSTNLGYMLNNERIVKMTIVNDNIGAATNIKLSIQQYMDKIGYTWALISLDGTNYLNEIQIDSIAAQSTRDFWVKVVKGTNSLAFEPIYFNVHLKHN